MLVYQNVSELRNRKSAFEQWRQSADTILSEFAKLGIGSIETDHDFRDLCQSDTQQFVKNWMLNHIPGDHFTILGGLKLSRSAVAKMVETPNLDSLKTTISEHGFNAVAAFELGTIHDNKTVFSPEKYAEIERNFSIYAETTEEVKAFEAVSEMIAAAQKLIDMGAVFPEGFAVSLSRAGITQQILIDGKLTISEKFCILIKRKINNVPMF